MKASPWLAAGLGIGILALSFGACKGEVESESGGSAGTTSNSSGMAGMGGASASSSSSSSSGTGGKEILTCPVNVATFDITKGECDFLNQDCPPGKTCEPFTFNGNTTTKCLDAPGIKGIGVPCGSHNECQSGLFCGFYCSPPCCPDDNKPCPGGCNFTVPFAGGHTANICTLTQGCVLFTANPCVDPGFYCHYDSKKGSGICAPLTGNLMEPTEGQACQFLNDCGSTQFCFQNTCRMSCLVDKAGEPPEMGGCPPNRYCTQLSDAPPAYPMLGVCLP